jgi:hypothetical protein
VSFLSACSWKFGIDGLQVFRAELNLKSGMIAPDVIGAGCFRDRDHSRFLEKPGKRDLEGACPMLLPDRLQGAGAGEPALLDGAVGHQRHSACRHPRDQLEFRAAPRDVVEHLVGRAVLSTGHLEQFLHVLDVEVAHAPVADLPRAPKLLEAGDRFLQRHGPAPVQEVKVEPVRPEALETALAGLHDAPAACIVRIDLAHEEKPLALVEQSLGDKLLGGALPIHFGGIDQGHPKLDAKAQRLNLLGPATGGFGHLPGALSQHRNGFACRQHHISAHEGPPPVADTLSRFATRLQSASGSERCVVSRSSCSFHAGEQDGS